MNAWFLVGFGFWTMLVTVLSFSAWLSMSFSSPVGARLSTLAALTILMFVTFFAWGCWISILEMRGEI